MPSDALSRLLEAGPPLEASAWSLDEPALELLVAEVAAGRRRLLECGSGRSTVIVARMLRERDGGTIHALEHDPGWVARSRARLAAEGLEAHATVVEAPLAPDPLAQPGCEWYELDALECLPNDGVDLLLVDGPPASPGSPLERARYPALPRLADRLAPGATVILDDALRDGEGWVLDRWREELGVRFDSRPEGVAVARWRR